MISEMRSKHTKFKKEKKKKRRKTENEKKKEKKKEKKERTLVLTGQHKTSRKFSE